MDNALFIILLSIILTVTNCFAHTAIVKPFSLKKGDTVAIVAPSFQFEKKQLYEAERLQSFGLKPIYDDTIFHQYGYFAGAIRGHQEDIFTVLIGSMVEVNAKKRQI